MDPADAYDDNADMQDIGNNYGEAGQVGQGPYFNMANLDPSLSNGLNHDMANIHLGGAAGISPTQAYGGDLSSEAVTPSNSKSAARAKKGKKAQAVQAKGPESEVSSEEEDEEEDEVEDEEEDEEEEDEEEEEEEEPVIRKKYLSATKLKTPTPKARKGTSKSSTRTLKTTTRRSGGSKVKDAMPFNRQRRPPKNGIMDARPIPRSYEECDEADKALLDMRDQEHKTWKDVRVAWEELTGQKTGNSTLPNRYE